MRKILLISALLGMLTASVLFLFLSKQTSKPANPMPAAVQESDAELPDSIEESAETDNSVQSNLSITYGKRAVTIAANDIQGVAGVLKKDDYVDVISLISPNGDGHFVSQIVLQQIKVLAVGSYRPYTPAASPDESEAAAPAETASAEPEAAPEVALPYAMVTLEVLPEEGAKLALAANSGSLVLMLRPRKDPTGTKPEQFTTDQLLKGEISK